MKNAQGVSLDGNAMVLTQQSGDYDELTYVLLGSSKIAGIWSESSRTHIAHLHFYPSQIPNGICVHRTLESAVQWCVDKVNDYIQPTGVR